MGSVDDRSIDTPGAPCAGCTQCPEWPIDLLQAVWSEQRHLLDQRIEVIERAVSALDQDHVGERLRAEAQRAAHMLAGSLGIFGFQEASQAARDLETEMACPACERTQTVRKLIQRLRDVGREPLVLGTRS